MEENFSKLTLATAINDFLSHCVYERKLDCKTVAAYRLDLNQFAGIAGEAVCLRDLCREDVKRWLVSLSHYQHKSVKRKIASLRVFLRYVECGFEEFDNPMRRLQIHLKSQKRLPEVMTREEVGRVLYKLEDEANKKACGAAAHILAIRNRAIIELLFGSGMRIGELCGLHNKDVDLLNGRVRILGKGHKERVVDVCLPVILNALHQWLKVRKSSESPQALFFTSRRGRALEPQTVRTLVSRLRRDCGIEKHVTPHTFRHTFATLLLEENVDVACIQHILGHSSIATTQIYLHVSRRQQRDILQNRHPRGRM